MTIESTHTITVWSNLDESLAHRRPFLSCSLHKFYFLVLAFLLLENPSFSSLPNFMFQALDSVCYLVRLPAWNASSKREGI